MKDEYDFSKGIRNPYISRLKTPLTINVDNGTVKLFDELSQKTGVEKEKLISDFLLNYANEEVLRELV